MSHELCVIEKEAPSRTRWTEVFSVFHRQRRPSRHLFTTHECPRLHVNCLPALRSPKPKPPPSPWLEVAGKP